MRIDVVIPIHNIYSQRGISRLLWSVHSISQQIKKANKIIVICSSKKGEYDKVKLLLAPYEVEIIYAPANKLNLSRLNNLAIASSDADFIQILGCDFLLRSDYLQAVSKRAGQGKLIIKAVKMLPKMDIKLKTINYWNFPKTEYNEYGDFANGIICGSRQWFLDNPYDERFELLGGMDNMQVLIAKKTLAVEWMEESEILHIHHKISQMKAMRQFQINQGYIREYVKP